MSRYTARYLRVHGPSAASRTLQKGPVTVHSLQGQPLSLRLSPLGSTQSTHPCSYSTVYFPNLVTCCPVCVISRCEILPWAQKAVRHLQATTTDWS